MHHRTIILALAALVLASATPGPAFAQSSRDERRELRQKIENYSRALREKEGELNEATGQAKQAEADARGAIEREKEAEAKLTEANEQAVAARQIAADANRAAVEHEKRLRDRVDEHPDVVAAAEHFDKVDRARQKITESVLVPVRASDAYKAKQKELADVEKEKSDYLAVNAGNVDPQRVQLLMAQQQTAELELKQMELTAIGASEQASAARAAAEDASAKLSALRDEHLRALRDGPESSQVSDTLAEAKRTVGEKNKAIADARKAVSVAEANTRKAKAKYAFYADQVEKKQREVDGLENAIRELRRQLDNK